MTTEQDNRILELLGQYATHREAGLKALRMAMLLDDQGYQEQVVNEFYGCSIAMQLICCAVGGSAAIDLLVDPQEYHDHVQEALDSLYDGSMFDVSRFLWPVT